MTQAAERGSRVETLDILRGVAVMGILAMNAAAFSMPDPAYANPAAYGGTGLIDLGAWLFNFVFFDGKMRGLFSLLFGASMLLIVEQARAKGESPAAVHYRRIFWLGLFGALHFYFIWWGDILLHYALIGLVAYFFCRLGTKALGLWIAFLLLVDLFIMAAGSFAFIEASRAAMAPNADAAATHTWSEMAAGFAPLDPAALARDLEVHRGGYLEMLHHRWDGQALAPFSFLPIFGPETLMLMLIGIAGFKNGFLTGSWSNRAYRRIALWCILPAAAVYAVLAAIVILSDFHVPTLFTAVIGATIIPRLSMIIGYAALIVLATRKGGPLVARIAAAGRMAFSNYLGTSIVMTFIFYGWGLGLYGSASRAGMWLFVIAVWILILAWSKPWLDRYRYGPLEWLWRSLARMRLQPMRPAQA